MPDLFANTANPNGGPPIDVMSRLRALQDTSSSTTPAMQAATSTPVPGVPISDPARQLCLGFEAKTGKPPGLGLQDKLLAHIQQSLKSLPGNMSVRRESGHQSYESLQAGLDSHRGPVLVLAPNGRPQFIFEWKGGEWNGYHAMTPFQRLADQAPPALALQRLFLDSGHAMCFSTYRVKGWKDAMHGLEDQDGLLILQEERPRGEGTAAILRRRESSLLDAESIDKPSPSPRGDGTGQEESLLSEKGRYA